MSRLRLLRNRKSLACRELGPFSGCDAGDARPEYRTLSKGDGECGVRSAECGVRRECTMYGCSKNALDPATLCHFFAPLGRLSGNAAGSVSRGRIVGSDVRCGRPGDPG